MALEALLVSLLDELKDWKETTPAGPVARNIAVLNTEIEKAYAYYLMYVCPHESDIPGHRN